jgi:hypothetical protein
VSYATDNPYAVVDEECDPSWVVIRYDTLAKAEKYLAYLAKHGGTALRAKVERGGYGIDGP